MTSPLTGWPPPAAAAVALPSCAAAGPGTVKGPEPPLCSPTALCPPPSPSWDPKGLRGVGDTQDRTEALLEPALGEIPLARIQSPLGPWRSPGSPSSAAAGTASAEQEGNWEHPPTPHGYQRGVGVPQGPSPCLAAAPIQLPAPPQLPTCQGCLLHGLAWVQPRHPRLVRRLQLLVLQGGLLQRGQLPVGTASALTTGQ